MSVTLSVASVSHTVGRRPRVACVDHRSLAFEQLAPQDSGHGLLAHMLDVAAVAETILALPVATGV